MIHKVELQVSAKQNCKINCYQDKLNKCKNNIKKKLKTLKYNNQVIKKNYILFNKKFHSFQ